MEIHLHTFLTSALDGDTTIKTARFPRMGGWLVLRTDQDDLGEEKKFVLILGIEKQTSGP
jgi:hypothetical protein